MEKSMEEIKLLIVDDNETSLKLLGLILNDLGYKNIIKANSGDRCLLVARQEAPDLIFLDIMMPNMDGIEVKRRLLENRKTQDIPTIFTTAIVDNSETERDRGNIGGHLYVAKPYYKDKIQQAIEQVL